MSSKRIINAEAISQQGVAANASFQLGLTKGADPMHLKVATLVKSSTAKVEYSWLGKFPRIREWVGDRILNQLKAHTYTITNKSYENTVTIDRDEMEDDTVGLFAPIFQEMGQEVADFPSELVFSLLRRGQSELCYDGQFFFDVDHPVTDAAGQVQLVSNWQGGTGDLWVVAATSRALKPIILQVRRPFENVMLDRPDDPNVFMRKEYIYGCDGRMNVGFGFWQFAIGSRLPLTPDNFKAAVASLENMVGDGGRPLGLKPDLLITTPSNRSAGQQLLETMLGDGGKSNEWYKFCELAVTPWMKG